MTCALLAGLHRRHARRVHLVAPAGAFRPRDAGAVRGAAAAGRGFGRAIERPARRRTWSASGFARSRQRGVLRVGFFTDAVPWAFVNAKGKVVGHDIEAAHRLAEQLGVKLEFVAIRRMPPIPSTELNEGHIDIVMSGLAATVSRAERMELSVRTAVSTPGSWCTTTTVGSSRRWRP